MKINLKKISKLNYIGALTSKSYAFKARPWEIYSRNFIDLYDILLNKIRLDIFNNEVIRIVPRYDNALANF